MFENKNLQALYGLPDKVVFCKTCTISNQRPRITFDQNGVCSACNFADHKSKNIDWESRGKELEDLCNKYRKKNGDFDVIVPCSGGKDGSYVAHQLKHEFGMNPLCVTWSPLRPTDIGKKNLEAFIGSGFSHVLGTPNPKVTQQLTKLSLMHLGDPFQPFIYGQTNFPLLMAVKYGVSLIFYGENGEVEYGGDMKNANKPTRSIEDHDKHYFSNMPPEKWSEFGVSEKDMREFGPPNYSEIITNNTQIHFFGYYKFWDPQENYYYCREKTGFLPNSERTEGTYSKYASLDDKFDGFHYYLGFVKFGIGRTTSDTAHEIRDGKISRQEGMALVERYDAEFPSKNYKEFLDYCGIDEVQFETIIDSWRSPHIWSKVDNAWELRKAIWQ